MMFLKNHLEYYSRPLRLAGKHLIKVQLLAIDYNNNNYI